MSSQAHQPPLPPLPLTGPRFLRTTGHLDRERIGQLVGAWKQSEVEHAAAAWQCSGLNVEQISDLYQDTTISLLDRSFKNDDHLRNTLRLAIRQRALTLRRDETTHRRILQRAWPAMKAIAHISSHEQAADMVLLAEEDQRIVTEFLLELTEEEQSVYWHMTVEGMGHIRIATALKIDPNVARNTMRACERKRERWVRLYTTGRLCGYRAQTINALEAGTTTSEELTRRALAHLERCQNCRHDHPRLARALRRDFEQAAAALLPGPLLAHHLGWVARLTLRVRSAPYQLVTTRATSQGTTGERATALLGLNGGSGARIAMRAGLLAVLAGAIGATHLINHHTTSHPDRLTPAPQNTLSLPLSGATFARTGDNTLLAGIPGHPRRVPAAGTASNLPFGPGHVVASSPRHTPRAPAPPEGRVAGGGFAYLGVPTVSPQRQRPRGAKQTGVPGGGGEFSP